MNELPDPPPINARGMVGIWRDAKKELPPDARDVIVYTDKRAFTFECYFRQSDGKGCWSGDEDDGRIIAWAQLWPPTEDQREGQKNG